MEKLLQVVYEDLLVPSTSLEYWNELIAEAEIAYSRVLSEFIKRAGTVSGSSNEKKFIGSYQSMCTDVVNHIDRIESFVHPLAKEVGSKYREVALQLLQFIESNYAKHMTLSTPLPFCLSDAMCEEMMTRLEALATRHRNQSSELFPLLKAVLAKDLGNPLPLTYGRYFVWKKVLAELEVMQLSITEYKTFDCHIREVLMQNNFNAKDFVDFYKRKLDDDVMHVHPASGRVNRITFHHNYLKAMGYDNWLSYDLEKPDLKKALLKYVKLLAKQLDKEPQQARVEVSQSDGESIRLQTTIQQKSMVKLLFALWQMGMVKPQSKAQLAKWISESFCKKNGETISEPYVKRILSSTSIEENEETLEALETLMQTLDV